MTPEPKYRAPQPSGTVHLDGVRKRALEMGRNRLVITAGVFALAFFAIGVRMIDVTVVQGSAQTAIAGSRAAETRLFDRAEEAGRLYGLRLEGVWMHVGTPEAIEAAEKAILASAA